MRGEAYSRPTDAQPASLTMYVQFHLAFNQQYWPDGTTYVRTYVVS